MKIKDIKKFEKLNNIELPRDDTSETGVIGTLLCHPDYIFKTEYLKPNMFYNRELACVYHIINELINKGISSIDNFMILTELEGNNAFKNIINEIEGLGNDILGWLDNLRLVSRDDIESFGHLAMNVVTTAFKRDTYVKLTNMAATVLNSNEDINKINYEIQTDIVKFSDKYIVDSETEILGNKAEELWELIKSRRTEGGYSGIPSKFKKLNDYFTYENGELVIIGGRAKSGKSMFFLNEAIHKVENGVPTAIFDTEMNDERWMIRFLAYKANVDIKKVKNGTYSLQEGKRIEEAVQWLKNKPLVHIYDPEWTMDKIYIKAKSLIQTMGLGFLIYDYIKVDTVGDGDTAEHNQLGNMTNFLKNKVAGALDIPILAGGQMSPKEQRLADSDKINRYASTVAYWIHKTKEEIVADGSDAGNCKFIIDYNRNGSQMDKDGGEYLNFIFDGNKASIQQAKKFENSDTTLPF